jgi:hypothetical protein
MIVYEIKTRFKIYRKFTFYDLLRVHPRSLASTTYEVFYVYRIVCGTRQLHLAKYPTFIFHRQTIVTV